ncbi:MAG: cysteine--tRNA ligase, partial [Candidatus Nealsonbacteria bacterium]|nr:cysteine--tRNA ligase [Candidatus Nealsonbacteria bacterium]
KISEFKKDKGKVKKENIKKYKDKFVSMVEDDLAFHQAIALIWIIIKDNNLSSKEKETLILDFDKVLGLNLKSIKKVPIPKEIEKLADERERARKGNNWQKSDELRKQIEDKGYKIEDTSSGPIIKKI